MFLFNLTERKFLSISRSIGFALFSVLLLFGCGGGGGGGSTETPVAVTINGKVYDETIAGATVDILVGDTVVDTTTTDASGQYSFDLSVTNAQRSQRCVVQARKGTFSLQSLLGTVGAVTDSRDSGGQVSSENLPAVVVSNVTTALVAIVKRENGGSLPSDQTTIDNLLATITASTALQTEVNQIAAAIKAVVDYGADPAAADATVGNTQELADSLAGSASFSTDLAAVIGSNTEGYSESDLINQVVNDPVVAVQLPATVTGTDLVGNYYVVGDDTLLYFSSPSVFTVADYDTLETGGIAGTWSYDAGTESITLDFTDPVDGAINVVATILGGTVNAVQIHYVVSGTATTEEGDDILQRLEPIGTGANLAESDFVGNMFIDFDGSNAAMFPSTCDGTTTTGGWITGADNPVSIPTACDTFLGMIVLSPNWGAVGAPDGGKIIIGMLSGAWDVGAGAPAQSANFVSWELDSTTSETITSFGRGYRPVDSKGNPCTSTCPGGTTPNPIALRIDTTGSVSLRLLNTEFVDDANPAEILNYSDSNATPREKFVWVSKDIGWGPLVTLSNNNNTLASSSGARVVVQLGKHAGSNLQAVFTVDNNTANTPISVKTRASYRLRELTSNDISGKTFNYSSLVDPADTGTVTFNAGGTGTLSDSGGSGNFTWSIGADTITNSAHGGSTETYTTLLLDFTDEINVVYGADIGDGSFIVGGYNKDGQGNITGVNATLITPQ